MGGKISISDFEKLDLKVGEIVTVQDIEGADKLFRLEVDVGGKQVTLVAGIKEHYKKEELVGKRIIVLTNLEPMKIRGVYSEGMLLAAVNKEKNKISLLTIDKDIEVGSDVA